MMSMRLCDLCSPLSVRASTVRWCTERIQAVSRKRRCLLLLGNVNLGFDGDDLTQHNNTVAVHKGNTGETLAVLEAVGNQRLLGLEGDLGHLVGLQVVGIFHLLTTGFLSHLPLDSGDTAGSTSSADETDRGVTSLDLVGDVENLDLGVEGLDGGEGGILPVDHDITTTGHVVLLQVLNVHTDVVTGLGLTDGLVVHFDGEHLTGARVGSSVGRHEDDFIGLEHTLFNTTGQDITDTLDLVDTGDGQTHSSVTGTLRDAAHFVQAVVEGRAGHFFAADLDLLALPPVHVLGGLDQVVTSPSGDGHVWDTTLDEVLLPTDLLQHILHFVHDLVVTGLFVSGGVAIHLVDTDDDLLDTQQVDETGVLTGLTLDLTGLVVTLLDGGGKVTISGDHDHGDISLGGTGNHVLDEISVAGGIDDGVVVIISEELLGGDGDGHTTLTLFLLTVHVESEGERTLTETFGLLLELFQFTLGDTTESEDEVTSRSGLTTIDVAADDDGQMLLTFGRHF